MENPAKKNWIKILVIVVAVVLLAGCSAMAYLYSQIAPAFDEGEAGTLNQQTDPDIEAGGDRFYNLLMVGIDYDADDDIITVDAANPANATRAAEEASETD